MDYIQHDVHGILTVAFITEVQKERGWKVIDIDLFLKEKKIKWKVEQLGKMTRAELAECAQIASLPLEQNPTKAAILERLIQHERDKLN